MNGWHVEPVEGVEIRYTWEEWHIEVGWPQRTRSSDITALIKITYRGAGGPRLVQSTTRINLLSASAVNNLIAAMGKHANRDQASELMHNICEHALEQYRRSGRVTFPQPARRKTGGWLLYPLWPATGATAVAAAPDSYKSVIAEAAALQLTTGVEILSNNTRAPSEPKRILYLDWEADQETFQERMYGLIGNSDPGALAYRSMRAPLTDVALQVSEDVARGNFHGVIVDSMSAGVGGAMVDDEIVNRFWDAVRLLGVPVLVIAHKSADNINRRKARFFGSIMSEARVRLAWNAERAKPGNSVKWEVFKDNHTGRGGEKVAWVVSFDNGDDEEDRRVVKIHIRGVNPRDVRVAPSEGETLADKIAYALVESGPLMAGEIAQLVGCSDASVRSIAGRHADMFAKLPDGRWGLK